MVHTLKYKIEFFNYSMLLQRDSPLEYYFLPEIKSAQIETGKVDICAACDLSNPISRDGD